MSLFDYLFPQFESYLSGGLLFGALMLLGSAVGLITGLFGVGGGFLAVPMMNIVLGIPYEMAVGSSVCMIIGTSTSGVLKHKKLKTIHYPTVLNISLGSTLGVLAGDMLQDLFAAVATNSEMFKLIMHGFFLALLTFLSAFMIHSSRGNQEVTDSQIQVSSSFLVLFCIGFAMGTLTGLLGISGGVLLIPILVSFLGYSPSRATGTSFGIVFISAVISIIKKSLSDVPKISLMIVAGLLLSSVIGVQIGILLNDKLHMKRFKRSFAFVLIGAVMLVAFDFLRKVVVHI